MGKYILEMKGSDAYRRFDIYPVKKWEQWKDGKKRVEVENCIMPFYVDVIYDTKEAVMEAFYTHMKELLKKDDRFADWEEIWQQKAEKQAKVQANKNKYIINKSFRFPFGKYRGMKALAVIKSFGSEGENYIAWFVRDVGATIDPNFEKEMRKAANDNSQHYYHGDAGYDDPIMEWGIDITS